MSSLNDLLIKSLQGNYFVNFKDSISSATDRLNLENTDNFLIIDSKVWELHKESMKPFSKFPRLLIDVSESNKTLDQIKEITEWLVQQGATKSSSLIAIGGGMVQDLATFTAHIYYRGIKWIYFPTTLLSQSDSCIGAKCALNLLHFKNQLGVIHSPSLVVICPEFLLTLDNLDYSSGYGEILKLSLTGKFEFYEDFKIHVAKNGFAREKVSELIWKSLKAKQNIVELDEYESDLRRILNYGHSFGHALESLTDHKIPHGAAIVFGMDLMNYLGINWKITDPNFCDEFSDLAKKYFVNYTIPKSVTPELLVSTLRTDKKMSKGKMNFAVAVKPGEIIIHNCSLDEQLVKLVSKYFDDKPIFPVS